MRRTFFASCLLAAGLAGCAAVAVRDVARSELDPQVLARAERYAADNRTSSRLAWRLALAAEPLCTHHRLAVPARLARLHAGLPMDPQLLVALKAVTGWRHDTPAFIALDPALEAHQDRPVASLNEGSIGAKQANELAGLAARGEPVVFGFVDGTRLVLEPVKACQGDVGFTLGHSNRKFDVLGPLAVGPEAWLHAAHTDAERSFVLARMLYYTGGPGATALSGTALAAAVPLIALRIATLGLSGIVDTQVAQGTVGLARHALRADADQWALRAMMLAGFDPREALAYAERVAPLELAELDFDSGRLATMRELATALAEGRESPAVAADSAPQ